MTVQVGDRLYYRGKWREVFTDALEAWFKEHPRPRSIKYIKVRCTANRRGYLAAWAIQDEKLYLVDIFENLRDPSDAMAMMFHPDGTPRLLCPECGLPCTEEKLSDDYCPECGKPSQKPPCSKCGKSRDSIATNFCSQCGEKLPDWKCPFCGSSIPKWMRERFPFPSPGSRCVACGTTLPEDKDDTPEEPGETPSVPPVFASWYSGVLRIPGGKLLKYVHMGYLSVYERDILVHVEQGHVVKEEVRDNRGLNHYKH